MRPHLTVVLPVFVPASHGLGTGLSHQPRRIGVLRLCVVLLVAVGTGQLCVRILRLGHGLEFVLGRTYVGTEIATGVL